MLPILNSGRLVPTVFIPFLFGVRGMLLTPCLQVPIPILRQYARRIISTQWEWFTRNFIEDRSFECRFIHQSECLLTAFDARRIMGPLCTVADVWKSGYLVPTVCQCHYHCLKSLGGKPYGKEVHKRGWRMLFEWRDTYAAHAA